jgi:hypothetical protein
MRAMNRAVNRGPAGLRTVDRFDWFVGRADPRLGFVCGNHRGHIIGTPVHRAGSHSAGWHVLAESGPILLCSGSVTGPLSEPRPLTGTAPVAGSGINGDPYVRELTGDIDNWKNECDQFTAKADPVAEKDSWTVECVMAFPERSLDGFWSHQQVPAYKCPSVGPNPVKGYPDDPWQLVREDYVPFGTAVPPGVEVRGLGPIGVAIPVPDRSTRGQRYQTKRDSSSATNWTFEKQSYQVVLHCWNTYFSPPGKSP